MLFMIIETFKDRNADAVYERLETRGRGAPDGLVYHNSWIEADFSRCFQVMETDDVGLLQEWVLHWRDLAEFEIIPVSPSADVRKLMESRLAAGKAAEPG